MRTNEEITTVVRHAGRNFQRGIWQPHGLSLQTQLSHDFKLSTWDWVRVLYEVQYGMSTSKLA
jgi:hypothetical protein